MVSEKLTAAYLCVSTQCHAIREHHHTCALSALMTFLPNSSPHTFLSVSPIDVSAPPHAVLVSHTHLVVTKANKTGENDAGNLRV